MIGFWMEEYSRQQRTALTPTPYKDGCDGEASARLRVSAAPAHFVAQTVVQTSPFRVIFGLLPCGAGASFIQHLPLGLSASVFTRKGGSHTTADGTGGIVFGVAR